VQLEGILLWDNLQMETEEKELPALILYSFDRWPQYVPRGKTKPAFTLEGGEGGKLWDSYKPDPHVFNFFFGKFLIFLNAKVSSWEDMERGSIFVS
jgi:hypothetical protein